MLNCDVVKLNNFTVNALFSLLWDLCYFKFYNKDDDEEEVLREKKNCYTEKNFFFYFIHSVLSFASLQVNKSSCFSALATRDWFFLYILLNHEWKIYCE